jgi:phage terminase small subunit
MKPPPHLGKDGKQIWTELVSEFGITDAGGLALVVIIGECRDRLSEAQALIKRHGAVIATTTGVLRSNPALKVEVDARNGMLAALRMLNLDIEPLRDRPGRPAGTFSVTGDRRKRFAQQ